MDTSVFREKSLEKVKSPDSLNEYIRVADPGIWVLLAAVLALLAGFCVWGIFGTIRTTVTVGALCEDGTVTCTLSSENAAKVSAGMRVTAAGQEGTVGDIRVDESGSTVCTLFFPEVPAEGYLSAEIETEVLSPLSFLVN